MFRAQGFIFDRSYSHCILQAGGRLRKSAGGLGLGVPSFLGFRIFSFFLFSSLGLDRLLRGLGLKVSFFYRSYSQFVLVVPKHSLTFPVCIRDP